jgi:pyruvate formate-lyase/glycerol dehydratase family glycyl radical enzyme
MLELQAVTPRVAKLRERFRSTFPTLSTERAKIVTDYYKEHVADPSIIKRANLLYTICEQMTVLVEEDELIVGNLAPTYRGSTLWPEYGIDWLCEELKDGTFESRKRDEERHEISQEDKEYILSIEDFWRKNAISPRMTAIMPDGLSKTFGSGVISYGGVNMCTGPTGHFNANFEKVINKGFAAIRAEAQAHLDKLEGKVFGDSARKYTFYKAITIVCDAAILFSKRYAEKCREKAAGASEVRKAELLKMADSLDHIMENPCRTFHEAVQAISLYQLIMAIDGNMHGLTIGRLDQYLWKFLESDLKNNRTTIEKAQEVLDCFFLKIADCCKVWSVASARNSGGYTTGQHMTLGGQTKNGEDATNPVSFMMLQAKARLLVHEPPLSLRVHKGTPDELWESAIECSKRVGGVPTFQNDEIIIPALVKKGLSLEDARNYCIIGCVEPAGTGCEWSACGGSGKESYWNIANALVLAINNGINPLTGVQAGLPTGYLYEMKTFDEVKEAFVKQTNYFVDWHITMTNFYELVAAENMPLPIVSATMDGCMESGLDVTWGGAKYNSTGVSAIGCGNVADSLSAIKHLIFDKKEYTAREFYDAMMANWEGHEPLRQKILNDVPRYGNGDDCVDGLAGWATRVFIDRVNSASSFRGSYRPGLYSVSAHIAFGKATAATPDGRYAHEPLSDGVSPVQSMDKNGPTAILRSVSHLDTINCGNGTLLNMKFHPKSVEGEDGNNKIKDLIKTFFSMNGMHIQFNVVSNETLRDAQRNPDAHKDLVIRIAGFSAYFIELYKELQDDLIRRNEIVF